MEPFLKVTRDTTHPLNPPPVNVTNLYSSPLVAITWSYRCGGGGGQDGSVDAAVTLHDPWNTNQFITMSGLEPG
jgi:hypothetical protein